MDVEYIDVLDVSLFGKMASSSKDKLCELAAGLKIDPEPLKNKRKSEIIKTIRTHIDEKLDNAEAAQQKSILETCLEIVKDGGESSELMINAMGIAGESQEKLDENANENVNEMLENSVGHVTNNPTRLGVIRKDFTISGKIGDSDSDKDIGYLGTVRQIEDGLKRGYSENEVIAAVIKTITPKILRNYISMVKNLTIPKLFNILRLHYKEQSATELYQSLVSMKQEKKEDASTFIMRALETREKILFAARGEESVSYDYKTVQSLCIATIESGIDEDIASIIRPFLQINTSDMLLLSEVNKAEETLKARKKKHDMRRVSTVSSIESTSDNTEIKTMLTSLQKQINAIESNQKIEKSRIQITPQQSRLSSAMLTPNDVRQINAGVGGRESMLNSQEVQQINAQARMFSPRQTPFSHNATPSGVHQNVPNNAVQGPRQRGVCHACHSNGRNDCHHCFRCGSSDHVARGCRVRNNWHTSSLNSGGLVERGRQSQN